MFYTAGMHNVASAKIVLQKGFTNKKINILFFTFSQSVQLTYKVICKILL